MRNPYDHEYPPMEWTVAELADAIDPDRGPSVPAYGDVETWAAIEADDATGPTVDRLRERAASAVDEPFPSTPASALYEYVNEEISGRLTYLQRHQLQLERLEAFTVAECVEREGTYLDPILDYAWALCDRSTWVNPGNLWRGHDEENYADGLPRPRPESRDRTIDLMSVSIGFTLAELDHVLGEQLPEGLSERIREETTERIVDPYEARKDYWWLDPPTNNWNTVCNAGAIGTALHVEDDPERLARLVQKGVRSVKHYLDGFGPDGGTVEGVGYWNFGFGYYVILADLIESFTGGAYSLFDVPIVESIVEFPLGLELSPGRYVPFSDGDEEAGLAAFVACEAGRRVGNDRLVSIGRRSLRDDERNRSTRDLQRGLRDLAWTARTDPVSTPSPPPESSYYGGIEWWTARADPSDPDGLVIAAKGGDNAESHNHNDCGSFLVHHRGESLFTDLGSPMYSPDYFGEGRYDRLGARSLGHSVPYVNGTEQESFKDYGGRDDDDDDRNINTREAEEIPASVARSAEVIDRPAGEGARDGMTLELAGCYPESAGLDSLRREFVFDRGADDGRGSLTVSDVAQFREDVEDPWMETNLSGYAPIDVEDGAVVATGDRGRAIAEIGGDVDARVECIEDGISKNPPSGEDEPIHYDVWRARVGPVEPDGDGAARIEYEIRTEPLE
jgi:hypothetical protein